MSKELFKNIRIYKRMLVEGADDLNMCYHLFKYHGIEILGKGQVQTTSPQRIEVVNMEGLDKLLAGIPKEVHKLDLKHLGILVDADENCASRWQTVRDILVKCGYETVPAIPDPCGTIIREDDGPAVGIWIMPDNQLPGMLEHFCRFLVPEDDRLWVTAENALQYAIEQERRFHEQHTMKAHLHTWLAWQEDPGRPIGQAIAKKYLDPQASYAQPFMQWIRQIFEVV
jgi:hypothetical protein